MFMKPLKEIRSICISVSYIQDDANEIVLCILQFNIIQREKINITWAAMRKRYGLDPKEAR